MLRALLNTDTVGKEREGEIANVTAEQRQEGLLVQLAVSNVRQAAVLDFAILNGTQQLDQRRCVKEAMKSVIQREVSKLLTRSATVCLEPVLITDRARVQTLVIKLEQHAAVDAAVNAQHGWQFVHGQRRIPGGRKREHNVVWQQRA